MLDQLMAKGNGICIEFRSVTACILLFECEGTSHETAEYDLGLRCGAVHHNCNGMLYIITIQRTFV